jgi:hypothetical protein
MTTHRGLIGVGLSLLAGLAFPSGTVMANHAAAQAPKNTASTLETALLHTAPTLRPEALRAALSAWSSLHERGEITSRLLTVIDYGLPSTAKRLWVFDLASRRLLFHELVAHGRNSGGDMATSFSNEDGSLMTSLGAFVTGTTYVGRNGYSLRLLGMDPGLNDRAESRSIVMHGAPYVSEQFAQKAGRIGRSHGCPAVRADVARTLIDQVKARTLLYAWHPSMIPAATPTQVASSETQSVR